MSDKKQAVKSSKAQMVEVMTSWFKNLVHKKINTMAIWGRQNAFKATILTGV